ncbi:MAG: hypothetical protein CMP59_13010 [Flavobacteriales bacterium]|nr:hypothetical protein [Flavobacteriales bacterium]|tara:strand:- start:690 stop:983 length:294 start_codon:yes stop_codon:yes gene_type:complete
MLLVTFFTFFGLSAIQNLSYFTELFDGQKIAVNLNVQEEENETSNNEEAKEVKEKYDGKQKVDQFAYESSVKVREERHKAFCPSAAYIEVATPPPEA